MTIKAVAKMQMTELYNILFRKNNFNKIGEYPIFLGSLPNRWTGTAEKLQKIGIDAILSLNEPWERIPFGVSSPYSPEQWRQRHIDYKAIDALDHILLSIPQMETSADYIQEKLSKSKMVYVHCRAGIGRSATAIAAYLIKYQHMSPMQARNCIKQSRPRATIDKKMAALERFAIQCTTPVTK